MATPPVSNQRLIKTVVVNGLGIPGLLLLVGALGLGLYCDFTCPRVPDPSTGHVIRWSSRGGSYYVTAEENHLLPILWVSGAPFLLGAYFLRRRWNMLAASQMVPDYEKIRATYHDK